MTDAGRAASFYVGIGWNPLPSSTKRKCPAMSGYAQYRDGVPIPEDWPSKWWTPNIQLCTGTPWRMVVVDLDGSAGAWTWRRWSRDRGCPPTWTVRTQGGAHLYFSLPEGLAACPSRKVWGIPRGRAWEKHQFVEVLGDKALVVAPPSLHIDTGMPYRFLPGLSPQAMRRPAEIPGWVLDLPALPSLHVPPVEVKVAAKVVRRPLPQGARVDRKDTMAAMGPGDLIRIAASWGVRFSGRTVSEQWAECHAIGREDRRPSAGIHRETGVYSEPFVRSMSFLDLAVAMGAATDWQGALIAVRESL